ncbi:MAG TPA: TonB-dependent receptor [Gemmatimonadaceae bacterium]|nr:TonB-dependent receptor [Gemmatimonadaceae bacterium]
MIRALSILTRLRFHAMVSLATAALAFALASSAAAEPRAAGDTLSGSVRDSAGAPLSGAEVTLQELDRVAVAGDDGGFTFADVPAGEYTIVARRVGFTPVADKVTLPRQAPFAIVLARATVRLAPVTVTAARQPSDPLNSALPVSEMSGERLRREGEVSLAQTLDGLPGLRNLSTGQQVGKPVIHGLYGPRVLVTDDGMRLEDYSWSDEDGPSVDSRLAQRIEVVRGPSSVLYGSDAIGGVINVVPEDVPDAIGKPSFTRGSAELYGATNNGEFGGLLHAEGASGAFGWMGTLIGRTSGNFHTPTGNDSTPSGDIYDTGYYAVNGAAAVGLHGEKASGLLRYERYGGDFGLLDGPPVPDDNTSGPLRRLADDRVQLTTNFLLGGNTRLETRSQYQRHWLEEVVGDSRVGDEEPSFELLNNTFTTDVFLHHASGNWLVGTVGVSGLYQGNTTSGTFPLIPDAQTYGGAVFAWEQATAGRFTFQGGVRGDWSHVNADSNASLQLGAQSRSASAFTGDVGVAFRALPQLALTANVGRAFRVPTLYELFTNGPHLGEDRYEIGLPSAVPEVSLNVDAGARWEGKRFRAEIDFYRNQINNYLYIVPTGQNAETPNDEGGVDTLPVYKYQQTARAVLTGLDLAAEGDVTRMLTVRARFDFVNGDNDATNQPLPQMPPPRGDFEVEVHTVRGDRAYFTVGTHIVANQTRLGPFDTPTSSYALLNLSGGIEHDFGRHPFFFDLRVLNATNKAYSDFMSRYKIFAYEPGVNFILKVSTGL